MRYISNIPMVQDMILNSNGKTDDCNYCYMQPAKSSPCPVSGILIQFGGGCVSICPLRLVSLDEED